MVGTASCCGGALQQQGQGDWLLRGRMNTAKCREVFEENLLQIAFDLTLCLYLTLQHNSELKNASYWTQVSDCPWVVQQKPPVRRWLSFWQVWDWHQTPVRMIVGFLVTSLTKAPLPVTQFGQTANSKSPGVSILFPICSYRGHCGPDRTHTFRNCFLVLLWFMHHHSFMAEAYCSISCTSWIVFCCFSSIKPFVCFPFLAMLLTVAEVGDDELN